MKSTKFMKKYGSDRTSLQLSTKAEKVYSDTDPLAIYEDENLHYSIRGCFGDYDDLSAERVNEMLEGVVEELSPTPKRLILAEDNAMNYVLEEDIRSGIYRYVDWDLSDEEISELVKAWERGDVVYQSEETRSDLDDFNTFFILA